MDRLTNCKNRFTVYTCIKTSCCTNIDNVYFLVKVKKKKNLCISLYVNFSLIKSHLKIFKNAINVRDISKI